MKIIEKPDSEEYLFNEPMLAKLIPDDGLLLQHMGNNFKSTKAFLLSIPENKINYRYAKGKWTIKEVIIHLIDMERIYAYRALRFARNDRTALPGFDGDDYVINSNANDRTIESLLNELEAIRRSTILMVESFDIISLLRSGNIEGQRVSVRALIYHIAGHELHHMEVIKEKYL